MGLLGYTHVIEHEVLLEDDMYIGGGTQHDQKSVGAAYNRQFGNSKHPPFGRIIMYWDANREWLGWSYMHDYVTDIGKPVDGCVVYPLWRPLKEPRGSQVQEMTWCMPLVATTEFDPIP